MSDAVDPVPDAVNVPTLTVEQAARYLSLGRSAAYEAVRRGEIPSLKFGRSVRVPTAALRRLLELDPPAESEASSADVIPFRPGA